MFKKMTKSFKNKLYLTKSLTKSGKTFWEIDLKDWSHWKQIKITIFIKWIIKKRI